MDPILFPSSAHRTARRPVDDQTGDLFAVPATNSTTSKAAARAADPAQVVRKREKVRLAIDGAGRAGLARFQIAAQLKVEQHRVTSSVEALVRSGVVVETTRTAFNDATNRNCAVLVAARYAQPKDR